LPRLKKYRPLPPTELAICQRVREQRVRERATQSGFARELRLTRDQLASIETGRVAISFNAGWRLCELMDLNPLWLASGEYESSGWIDFDFGNLSRRARFSEIIERHKEEYNLTRRTRLEQNRASALSRGVIARDLSKENQAIIQLAHEWDLEIPRGELPRFVRYLRRCADFFNFDTVNSALTLSVNRPILLSLKPRKNSYWKQLRRRVIAAVDEPGAKAKLARYLGITRQAVSEWIRRDDRAPSAEYTLRLLEWVAAEEAKQKQSAERALTRPAQKTRVRKSKHEKPNSDRKKK
jgi:transcriptional regulator with XRE-family HTH domain